MTEPNASDERLTLLTAMLNLTAAHREHERFSSVSPREQAVVHHAAELLSEFASVVHDNERRRRVLRRRVETIVADLPAVTE